MKIVKSPIKGLFAIKILFKLQFALIAFTSNKFFRGSFAAVDLIKISDFLKCNLSFVISEHQNITLDMNDVEIIQK